MAVQNRIKAVLAEQGKSNKWLAEAVGKSTCTVGQWCNNKCQPKPEIMAQIAAALGVEENVLKGE